MNYGILFIGILLVVIGALIIWWSCWDYIKDKDKDDDVFNTAPAWSGFMIGGFILIFAIICFIKAAG